MRKLLLLGLLIATQAAQAQKSSIKQAHQLLSAGALEEALDMFNSLDKDYANDPEFYFLRGSCHSELGNNDMAILDLNISISLDPSNANAFYQRGFTYFADGQSKEALDDFDKAIALSPSFGEAYLNRGTVQYDLGNPSEACKDWQLALDSGLTLAQALLEQLCEN